MNTYVRSDSLPPMNGWLRAYRLFAWLGIVFNLGFILPALFAPDLLETVLGPGAVELSYVWVAAAGMVLAIATVFYIPAAKAPRRYPSYAWLSVAGRGLAAAFWIWTSLYWALPGPIAMFWIGDFTFFVLFLVCLQFGMPERLRIGAANLARVFSDWRWPSSAGLAIDVFRSFVLLAVAVNLAFALPALLAPVWLAAQLGTTPLSFTYLWLGNTGVLLVQVCLFQMPAARDPVRNHVYAWLAVASSAAMAVFWLWQYGQWQLLGPSAWFWLPAAVLAVAQAVALQRALPGRFSFSPYNFFSWLGGLGREIAAAFPTLLTRIGAVIVAVALVVVGYGLWANLVRAQPDRLFPDGESQFKYGAIGLGQAYRVPLYLWEVIPEVCSDLLPPLTEDSASAASTLDASQRAWASLGVLYEDGETLPVGFALREIGYPAVEPNCALCHTGSVRSAPDAPAQLILGGSAHELDLQGFQWFLYDCANSPDFTPDNLLARIEARHSLGRIERLAYRYAILPFSKAGLAIQREAYQWQKSRPQQGRGRTDTFNPTKIVVFHQPDDGSIGTVDLPVIWNQRARVGLYLHWDGNNNDIRERNYAAAMAIGASPYSVLPEHFQRVTDYVLDLPPPSFPFPVDEAAAERGWAVFQQQCADCHAFGSAKVGTVTPIDEIGTDRHRLDSFTEDLVDAFHAIDEGPFHFDAYRKTEGYSNLPIDGAWARAPYLHNGSVPTLRDLLSPPAQRPQRFMRGSNVYDPLRMGFMSGPPLLGPGFELDTTIAGNSAAGHDYGTELDEQDKNDLIEYLKTL